MDPMVDLCILLFLLHISFSIATPTLRSKSFTCPTFLPLVKKDGSLVRCQYVSGELCPRNYYCKFDTEQAVNGYCCLLKNIRHVENGPVVEKLNQPNSDEHSKSSKSSKADTPRITINEGPSGKENEEIGNRRVSFLSMSEHLLNSDIDGKSPKGCPKVANKKDLPKLVSEHCSYEQPPPDSDGCEVQPIVSCSITTNCKQVTLPELKPNCTYGKVTYDSIGCPVAFELCCTEEASGAKKEALQAEVTKSTLGESEEVTRFAKGPEGPKINEPEEAGKHLEIKQETLPTTVGLNEEEEGVELLCVPEAKSTHGSKSACPLVPKKKDLPRLVSEDCSYEEQGQDSNGCLLPPNLICPKIKDCDVIKLPELKPCCKYSEVKFDSDECPIAPKLICPTKATANLEESERTPSSPMDEKRATKSTGIEDTERGHNMETTVPTKIPKSENFPTPGVFFPWLQEITSTTQNVRVEGQQATEEIEFDCETETDGFFASKKGCPQTPSKNDLPRLISEDCAYEEQGVDANGCQLSPKIICANSNDCKPIPLPNLKPCCKFGKIKNDLQGCPMRPEIICVSKGGGTTIISTEGGIQVKSISTIDISRTNSLLPSRCPVVPRIEDLPSVDLVHCSYKGYNKDAENCELPPKLYCSPKKDCEPLALPAFKRGCKYGKVKFDNDCPVSVEINCGDNEPRPTEKAEDHLEITTTESKTTTTSTTLASSKMVKPELLESTTTIVEPASSSKPKVAQTTEGKISTMTTGHENVTESLEITHNDSKIIFTSPSPDICAEQHQNSGFRVPRREELPDLPSRCSYVKQKPDKHSCPVPPKIVCKSFDCQSISLPFLKSGCKFGALKNDSDGCPLPPDILCELESVSTGRTKSTSQNINKTTLHSKKITGSTKSAKFSTISSGIYTTEASVPENATESGSNETVFGHTKGSSASNTEDIDTTNEPTELSVDQSQSTAHHESNETIVSSKKNNRSTKPAKLSTVSSGAYTTEAPVPENATDIGSNETDQTKGVHHDGGASTANTEHIESNESTEISVNETKSTAHHESNETMVSKRKNTGSTKPAKLSTISSGIYTTAEASESGSNETVSHHNQTKDGTTPNSEVNEATTSNSDRIEANIPADSKESTNVTEHGKKSTTKLPHTTKVHPSKEPRTERSNVTTKMTKPNRVTVNSTEANGSTKTPQGNNEKKSSTMESSTEKVKTTVEMYVTPAINATTRRYKFNDMLTPEFYDLVNITAPINPSYFRNNVDARLIPTSGKFHPCKKHTDCFNYREPAEWCFPDSDFDWTDRSCFCTYDTVVPACIIERIINGQKDWSFCSEHKLKCPRHSRRKF